MSLGFLLSIYRNELFGGYLMRLLKESPYVYQKDFAKEVFANGKERINYLHINNLRPDFARQLDEEFGLENIIQNHTLSGFDNLFGKFAGKSKASRYLRYCPMCEQCFQVLPQIEGLTHCFKHLCRYVDSNVSLDRNVNHLIKPFQSLTTDNVEMANSSSICVKLGKYIYDILNTSRNGYKRALIGQFIREHIPSKYRTNKRGTQIKLEILKNDLDTYYEKLETYSLPKRQLARILNDESVNPFQVCLIGFFLGISPEEMVSRKMKRHKKLYEIVKELKNKGLSERTIARRLKVSKTLVHKTLKKLEEQ